MTQYNVDFFDRKMNYVFHDTIDTPDIDMDYLSPDSSEIVISQTNDIPSNGILYINDLNGFVGIIESVKQGLGETTISFKPFASIFDQAVRFYTKSQGPKGTTDLETTIGGLINSYFGKDTGDEEQSLPITPISTSSTTGWTLDIQPDKEDGSYCICNLYSAILCQALTKYRVAVSISVNPNTKTIAASIGASPAKQIIDANMNGVNVANFTVDQLESSINKLEIWNASGYTSKVNYYLFTDGSYGTSQTVSGKERVLPVKMEVLSVTATSTEWKNGTKHKEQADNRFGDLKWKNYIELEVIGSNSTVLNWKDNNGLSHPMEIGQEAQIFYNGQFYDSILTGIRYTDVTILMFGRIRVDLSKKNKLKTNQEYIDAKVITRNSYTAKK
jgi:hypothetical protein